MANFDPAVVREKADAIFKADKLKVEDARQLFLEEIMDWTDYYSENQSTSTAAETRSVLDSIVGLWIQYAQFEISLNQFKKAVDVFDKAVDDPVCGKALRIYQTYATFCVDRKKPGNAQNVYIQGLCAGLGTEDNTALWTDFLSLMHTVNKSTKLSLEDLYEAVRNQEGVDEAHLAPPPGHVQNEPMDAVDANEAKEDDDIAAPHAPTPETASSTIVASSTAGEQGLKSEQGLETQPMTGDEQVSERRYAALDDLDDVTGYTPEQLIRTFSVRPPMLFTALHKEPTASGIAALTSDPHNPGAGELEAFLGIKLSELPNVTPNMHAQPVDFTAWAPADRLLDLLEGMWLAQALKERHFDSWISDLRNMHIEQEGTLVDSFIDTESEAAAGKSTDEKAAIKKRQHGELMILRNHCAVQQELLHALINKALFALLVEQQTQLVEIGFPRFSAQALDALRAHVASRKASTSGGKGEFDPALVQQVASQRELVCAFLSVRLHTISTERSRAAQLGKTKLSRAQSMDQESEVGGDLNYFDAEAKKRRKRRRIILQHHNDSYSQSGVSSYAAMDSPVGGYPSEGLSPGSDAGSGAGGARGGYPVGNQGYYPPQHQQQQQAYAQEQAEGNPAMQVLQKLSALIGTSKRK